MAESSLCHKIDCLMFSKLNRISLNESSHLILVRISSFTMFSPQPQLPRHRVLLDLLLGQTFRHRSSGKPQLMLERKIDIVELDTGTFDQATRLWRHHELRVALQVQYLKFCKMYGVRQSD